MLGSIIGDIVGSIYEFNNIKTKDFEFFGSRCEYTDDSVLTFATADWLLHGGSVARYYCDYRFRYPDPMGCYGTGFVSWAVRAQRQGDYSPYNSCGNGSAMRVGPVGWACDTKDEILAKARESAECTHNHPEGIKGAQATALAIFMARQGADKQDIRNAIESNFGYNLHFNCDGIRPTYGWGATCQDTVPQAIVAFLDGLDFEDCIRNAVSLGGDSDTLACITGSIAEAYFGIPDGIRQRALAYLPDELKNLLSEFETKFGRGEAK
ncbi:MAG: ADP-ribosylglycohydrolase family protein [Bacteroidales bacterium]|nr:ADP-ribosylglycohydrolase family protein [Bacteroidales bacterium]